MNIFLKCAAGTLIALILYLILFKHGRDISTLLTVTVCCMLAAATLEYLVPVVDFFERLQSISNLDSDMLQIVLRAVGIGLLSEVTALICTDAGNATLGKSLQLLASCVVLYLAIPLFTELLELIEEILLAI